MLWLLGISSPLYVDIIATTTAVTWPVAGFIMGWFLIFGVVRRRYPERFKAESFATHVVALATCVLLGWVFYGLVMVSASRVEIRELYPARPS